MKTEQTDPTSRSLALMQRAGWGVADQGISSLTNFALSVLVARSVSPAGCGSFTVVFVTYTTALGISRAFTAEPLLVHYSAPPFADWHEGTARATGAALLLGVGIGLCCVLVGWIAAGVLTKPFIALGLTLPGLLLQDCWRYAFFARGRGFSAFANDVVWALVLLPVFIVLLRTNQASVTWLALVGWGGAATVAALFGIGQSGVAPAPQRFLNWVREEAGLIPRFLGEFVAVGGGWQVVLYAVGAVAGLAALGSLQAGLLAFGPLHVLSMGLGAIAIPEVVRALQHSATRLLWTSRLFSLAVAGTGLVWGAVVLALPSAVGVAFLGAAWQSARLLAVPVMALWVASGVVVGAAAGLRALVAVRQSLRTRLAGSLLAVGGGVGGAVMGGAQGTAWGLALAKWIEAIVWWWQYTRVLREYEARAGNELTEARQLSAESSPVG
jgi:O-antigen/teichoic acid export membrane protein